MSISVISSVSSASASSAISSAISMSSVTGLAIGGTFAVLLLIVLLSSQEILSASRYWNKSVAKNFNVVMLPLLFVFLQIVIFKILEILN